MTWQQPHLRSFATVTQCLQQILGNEACAFLKALQHPGTCSANVPSAEDSDALELLPPVNILSKTLRLQNVSLSPLRYGILRPHRGQKATNTGHLLCNSSHNVSIHTGIGKPGSKCFISPRSSCSNHLLCRSFLSLRVADKALKGSFFTFFLYHFRVRFRKL